MNSRAGQIPIFISTILVLVIIGGMAAYKIFHQRERDDLQRSLMIEARALEQKVDSYLRDPDFCNLNFVGKLKNEYLDQLAIEEEGKIVPAYKINTMIGRLKFDLMKLDLQSEDLESSTVKFIYSLSNAGDEISRKALGVKEFKHEIVFKVEDCPVEVVMAMDEVTLRNRCESLPPEGLGGKAKQMTKLADQSPEIPYIMDCQVCRNRNRKSILACAK